MVRGAVAAQLRFERAVVDVESHLRGIGAELSREEIAAKLHCLVVGGVSVEDAAGRLCR
jgi:hypothetical protein